LNKSIEAAESLKCSAIKEFAVQTSQLLKIMGPKTVNYAQQKTEIEDQLRKEYEKEQKIHAEIAYKKGEMTFFQS